MAGAGFLISAATIGLSSILIKPKRGFYPTQGDDQGAPSPIIAQAVVEEIHHHEIEITDHPVESGAKISDHAYKRPAEVTIHCAWSDSPSGASGLIGQAIGFGAATINPIVGLVESGQSTVTAAQSLLSGNAVSQTRTVFDKLLELQASLIPFDVYTGKKVYRNMLFKSLTVTTDIKSENSLPVVAVLRQVLIVNTRVISTPINPKALKSPESNTPKSNDGNKSLISGATHK